jgi:hypothetical protein
MPERRRQHGKLRRISIILVDLLGLSPLTRFERPPKEIRFRRFNHIERVKHFARIAQISLLRLSFAKQRATVFGAFLSTAGLGVSAGALRLSIRVLQGG